MQAFVLVLASLIGGVAALSLANNLQEEVFDNNKKLVKTEKQGTT